LLNVEVTRWLPWGFSLFLVVKTTPCPRASVIAYV
jgi:hypothetical protein